MESSEQNPAEFPFTGRVVKLEVLKSLHYFIHHHPSISFRNRPAVKSCAGFIRKNKANSRLNLHINPLRHKVAISRLHDSIHGIAGRSRQDMLRLKQLGGSHVAFPLRWRGSFGEASAGRLLRSGASRSSSPITLSCSACSWSCSSFFLLSWVL